MTKKKFRWERRLQSKNQKIRVFSKNLTFVRNKLSSKYKDKLTGQIGHGHTDFWY